ncbi:choice-of-anchor Q domain-containing protein [Gimesia aquarii]|uniref:Putative outer membrane protein pmp20 n=1 Tax=Gimesia aquarii TaxID=2527964 RepID=A0A517W3X2_9PLAN|nr:choice-of-anchor Q domain-containing protein [Gimesia aquarii]QDT99961.1 putative outer membrane protein pmp20 precursor [Gimesia aquarii]
MFRFHWLTSLRNKLRADSTRRIQSQRKHARQLSLRVATAFVSRTAAERLEDRTLLTAFTVVNTNDFGTGSLREAIEQANASAGADTISFDASLAGQTIFVAGEITISDELTINGLGADQLTLSGNGINRHFYINDYDNENLFSVVMNGLTLADGYGFFNGIHNLSDGGAIFNYESLTLQDCIFSNNYAQVDGGAIRNNSGSLTVVNCSFSENTALNQGGAIYSVGGQLSIVNSHFVDNSANFGGGIYNIAAFSELTITNSTYSGNEAEWYGGGIYNESGSILVTNSEFSENSAGIGGGIYNTNFSFSSNPGIVTIRDTTFNKNHSGSSGGGIYNHETVLTLEKSIFTQNTSFGNGGGISNSLGKLSIQTCTFIGNSAEISGGGIESKNGFASYHPYRTDSITISDSIFSENTALKEGGGIFSSHGEISIFDTQLIGNSAMSSGGGIYTISSETITIENSELTGNSAAFQGGGLYGVFTSKVSINNSTVAANQSESFGGGIYVLGEEFTIKNSTLSGNTSETKGGGIYYSRSGSNSAFTILNCTIVRNSSAESGGGIYADFFTYTIINSLIAGNIADSDPQVYGSYIGYSNIIQDSINGLIDPILRDNGGPTKIHALLPDSIAINAGNNAAATDAGLTNDQRGAGFDRIIGDTVDIGAYEVQTPFTQLELRVVNSKTATQSNGESSSLPDNLTWVDEWSSYWLEIWISTPSTTDLGILSAALNLSYNTAITTATSIEYGSAFTLHQTGMINDVTGTIENLSAETSLTDVGDNQHVLFVRIKFESTSDDAIDLDLQSLSMNPQSSEFLIKQPEIRFVGGSLSEEVHGPSPETQIYANPYDLNDDDAINFKDLMLFASAYNTIPSESSSDYSWFADLNQSDRVNFKDLILFASNYGKRKSNQSTIVYPQNFPYAWNNQLLVDTTQGEPQLAPETLSQSTADIALNNVVEHVSPQLNPSQNETLEQIDIHVVDLEGNTLGRAASGTIYIDANAAGYGWFVDATPGDSSEFEIESQLSLIALPDTDAAGRVDLWSVIMHELGHLLGFEHEDTGLMQDTLPPGVRRLPSWELNIDLGNSYLPEEADSFFLTIQDQTELVPF